MEQDLEQLKYPIGKFQKPDVIPTEQLKEWIQIIASFPSRLTAETIILAEDDLSKRYRLNGWTIRQIVHHCADSHMQSFSRMKLALTEERPLIKPYLENHWAELPDSKELSIVSSLRIIEGLHERWVYFLQNLKGSDLQRTFIHPESNQEISIETTIGIYAWHCEHHLEHIVQAKKCDSEGKFLII